MIFVPPFWGYNKKIFRLASLAVICTPHLCKRCAAPVILESGATYVGVNCAYAISRVDLDGVGEKALAIAA